MDHNVNPALAGLLTPIDTLRSDPRNARTHGDRNIDAIAASLREFGQQKAIVTSPDGTVLAGNGTLAAAKKLGWTQVARVIYDGPFPRGFALADNRTAELAAWDPDIVAADAADLQAAGLDVASIGWSVQELDELLGRSSTGEIIEDSAPDCSSDPITRPGDLWRIGDHSILCGDSRSSADIARVLGDEKASVMWTDPPYGVSYVGKTAEALTIQNDGRDDLSGLLSAAFAAVDAALSEGAAIYVASPPGANMVTFGTAFMAAGWRLHQTLIWVKDSMVLGHSDYHFKHEPILFGYKSGGGRRGRGGSGWYGDDSQVSVFEIPRPKASKDHPTMKPVALVAAMLQNSSARGELVLEPFGGSGTTFAAAEQLGRRCRGLEVDPRYCDVIVERLETMTGKKAIR